MGARTEAIEYLDALDKFRRRAESLEPWVTEDKILQAWRAMKRAEAELTRLDGLRGDR